VRAAGVLGNCGFFVAIGCGKMATSIQSSEESRTKGRSENDFEKLERIALITAAVLAISGLVVTIPMIG